MKLILQRLSDNGTSTLGRLTADGFQCVTLEDTFRAEKVYGKTRIPAGRYEIKLRTAGRMHGQYIKKLPNHVGMLWLQDVPGFQYVYIHIGNEAADSSGCILVGTTVENEDFISESTVAYIKLYAIVVEALERDEEVIIDIIDNI
jgi:hypothetical protein